MKAAYQKNAFNQEAYGEVSDKEEKDRLNEKRLETDIRRKRLVVRHK